MPPAGQAEAPDLAPDEADGGPIRSLLDDAEDMLVDVRTWADAELAYQKTRARFVASSTGRGLALAGAAAVFGIVALIALSVGLIVALTPMITAWGATAVVVALLVLCAVVALASARTALQDARAAVSETEGDA